MPPEPDTVDLREVSHARVLGLPEDFGGSSGGSLTSAVEKALAAAPTLLVVDFSSVETVNSAGIGMLFALARLAREAKVPLVLAALAGQPKLVIERVRLPLYVSVYATVDEAIASQSAPRG